jgi:hypothetical protein
MLQDWQNLLARLKHERPEQVQPEEDTRTAEELQAFEAEAGIKLPASYKEFCQVFGTVQLGKYVEVYSPYFERSNALKASLKLDLELELSKGVPLNSEEISTLIDSAFVFTFTPSGDCILWDFRTYSNIDESYDIYLVPSNEMEGIYPLGRNFFEFIIKFCLGYQSYKILPKYRRPRKRDIRQTYTRFSLR